ncbi:MAG TPA: hypothetical protein VFZ23_08970 [Pyrinomonadaceae bacterium]
MRSLLLTAFLTALLCSVLACQPGTTSGTVGSPTEAYKQLYAAVKSKDVEKIKAVMSKKTHDFAQMVAGRQNQPVEKVFENGFTATTFAESLPEIRDERISGEFGAVEVWNAKDKRWEDLGFVYEDGGWKLAIGEMFGGTFKSPGKGRAIKEQEAANLANNNLVNGMPANVNINTNANIQVIVPKERPETNKK